MYNRCGYLAQTEIEYYLPDQCVLDGAGNLLLIAETHLLHRPVVRGRGRRERHPAVAQSGACQSNTQTYAPAAGNTMTFETRLQILPDIAGGMWPGLLWLKGQDELSAWKTNPAQGGVEHHRPGGDRHRGVQPVAARRHELPQQHVRQPALGHVAINTATDFSAALHVFTCRWKPGGVRDISPGRGADHAGDIELPASGCHFFLLLYLQILAGSATATEQCAIDYVRVYDQNLG